MHESLSACWRGLLVAAVLLTCGVSVATAQSFRVPDRANGDPDGRWLAVGEKRVLVGVRGDEFRIGASGVVHVFEQDDRGRWGEVQRLGPREGARGDWFGTSVAMSGDVAIVGAPLDGGRGTAAGTAYVFERDGTGNWRRTQLTAHDGQGTDRFGTSVAIAQDRAIVGAVGDNDRGYHSGTAYVFERRGGVWIEAAKLTPGDGVRRDEFGWSVAIAGDLAVVGTLAAHRPGSAYVFQRDAAGRWSESQKLLASDGGVGDRFAWSVAVAGGRILAGRPGRIVEGEVVDEGAVYAFTRDDEAAGAWAESQKLTARVRRAVEAAGADASPVSSDARSAGTRLNVGLNGGSGGQVELFGLTVAMSDECAIVGALVRKTKAGGEGAPEEEDSPADHTGAAHVFKAAGDGEWGRSETVSASQASPGERFVPAVALSDLRGALGVFTIDREGAGSRAIHVFGRDGK
jgi:hypothetical protein